MDRLWRPDTESGGFAVKGSLWPTIPSLQSQLEFSARGCEQAHEADMSATAAALRRGALIKLSPLSPTTHSLTPTSGGSAAPGFGHSPIPTVVSKRTSVYRP